MWNICKGKDKHHWTATFAFSLNKTLGAKNTGIELNNAPVYTFFYVKKMDLFVGWTMYVRVLLQVPWNNSEMDNLLRSTFALAVNPYKGVLDIGFPIFGSRTQKLLRDGIQFREGKCVANFRGGESIFTRTDIIDLNNVSKVNKYAYLVLFGNYQNEEEISFSSYASL